MGCGVVTIVVSSPTLCSFKFLFKQSEVLHQLLILRFNSRLQIYVKRIDFDIFQIISRTVPVDILFECKCYATSNCVGSPCLFLQRHDANMYGFSSTSGFIYIAIFNFSRQMGIWYLCTIYLLLSLLQVPTVCFVWITYNTAFSVTWDMYVGDCS